MADAKTTRVGIYCRVSTTDQTTSNQRIELERYCQQRGWQVVQVYEDTGVSGATQERPALDKLMQAVRGGKVDCVLVWKFDRMARSVSHLLAVLQEFRAFNTSFVSTTEGIDTSTPVGQMVFVFLAAVGEFERSLIRERVCAGVARAKAEGIHCGRPRKGYDVATALTMKQQGSSWKQVAAKIGIPVGTLRRSLSPLLKSRAA